MSGHSGARNAITAEHANERVTQYIHPDSKGFPMLTEDRGWRMEDGGWRMEDIYQRKGHLKREESENAWVNGTWRTKKTEELRKHTIIHECKREER